MRTWLPSLATLALVGAMSGGPAAGEERTSAAQRPLRIRVVTWKTTADGKRDLAPVAGANVVVRPRDGVVDLAAGRTGADGVVRLDVARQRRGYSLQATFAGLGMQCRQLDDEWLDTHDQPAEVRIEPASGLSLGGRVVDVATGRPIAGARVFENDVNPGRDRPLPQTSTETDGTFLFEGLRSPNGAFVYDGITTGGRVEGPVARGLVEVAVAAPGYVLVSRVVQVIEGRACDAGAFHLEPAGTIRGRVLHADGSPFADARIDVLGRGVRSPDGDLWHEMPGFAELEIRSAADGTFAFPHAPFGVPLTVGASAYGRWVETSGVRQQDQDHGLLDAVAGRVLTREKPDADVVLRESGEGASRAADLVVEVASGRVDVPARAVAGRLTRLGDEWPWAWTSSAESESGPLAFARVPAGLVRLYVAAKDLPDEVVDVEIDPRKGPTRLAVVLGGTATIEGRVVDEAGEPIAGASVQCGRRVERMSRPVPAGPQGEFKIEGLAGGRYVLLAKKPELAVKRVVYSDAPAQDVLLPLRPAGPDRPRGAGRRSGSSSSSGRFPVPGGAPGAGVTGVVLAPDGRPAPFAAVYTDSARECADAEGRFSIAPATVIHAATETTCPPHAAGMRRLDPAGEHGDVVIRLTTTRGVLVDATLGAPRSSRIEAEPRGDLRELRPWPDTTRFVSGHVDDRGVAFLRLLPGDWTLRLVALEKEPTDPSVRGETVLATTEVTVRADGDGPLRVSLPVR